MIKTYCFSRLPLVGYLIFLSLCVHAQVHEFTGYGAPTLEDIRLKKCSFDADADAVILLNEAWTDFDESYRMVTSHHIRLKILTDKARDAANVKIRYYRKDDFEEIYDIDGMTINQEADGNFTTTKLEKSSIFDRKINELRSEMAFAFPSVKAGSILEYKYVSKMKSYGGLDRWEFQDYLPVVTSRYNLVIVPNAEFAYRVSKRVDFPITITPDKDKGSIYFEMNNIPALTDEPYMDAREDYIQKVIFQLSGYGGGEFSRNKYMTSWDEVIRELTDETSFGVQLNKNIPGTSDFIKSISAQSPYMKMKQVYEYVKSNMSWNYILSKYSEEGIKQAWQKKKGNSGEINLILVNLLREAGLEAYPMLVSERFNGEVNPDYPFVDEFNTVFACVLIDSKKYYLNGLDKFTPVNLVPESILNTTALVVNKKKGGLINIADDQMKYDEHISTTINIKDNGVFDGSVTVNSNAYAKVEKARMYSEDKDQYLKQYFHKDDNLVEVKNIKAVNLDSDTLPMEQHADFNGTFMKAGDYYQVPLDLFLGMKKNPFLSDDRFSKVNFGYSRSVNLVNLVHLPAGYTVAEMPKSYSIVDQDKDVSVTRTMSYEKETNLVSCTISINFTQATYSTYMYPVLKDIYKKMFVMLQEPLLIIKK
ncbi:MAG: DUF3857 domain-containing protein [Bacteroidetes bacterium]|nr:DUF3857 domain-containing protein [Bacteroidota bacterium]